MKENITKMRFHIAMLFGAECAVYVILYCKFKFEFLENEQQNLL